ncbi:glycosyltransferase family 1 protein [Eubacteriaceae bacterium ES3]|nr:glycosyltransferase family 1 protein [Eubacteriaceae bacterium ES3]
MKEPVRILHVFGKLNRGGAETMIMNLYREIDRSKIQFDFVIHTEEECDYNLEIESLGGIIHHVPQYTGKNHFKYKKAWRDFFIEHSSYKIIHSHVRSTASIYLAMARKRGIYTIAHSHNTSSGSGVSSIAKNILQYRLRYIADDLFACSKDAGEWLFGNKCHFHILKNAIDTDKFRFNEEIRQTKRAELNVTDRLVIGHVGRFDPQKNHTFLIDIFKVINLKWENATLVLIGDGGLKNSIEKKVNDLGLEKTVIFTGVRSDVPELLQAVDVFLFPSLFEGLPLTLVEAQAAGLPCVISDTITREIVMKDELITFVLLEDEPETWADEVLKNRAVRLNAQDEIKNNGYDIHSSVEWLQAYYLKIFAENKV